MTLPSFNDGENVYRSHGSESMSPPVGSASERYRKILGLRQKIGRQILLEAAQVAQGLLDKKIEPDVQISEVKIETRRRFIRGTSVKSRVIGTYAGWRLVQAEKAWGEHPTIRSEEFAASLGEVVPAGVAFSGIALLTDGRLLPYESQSENKTPLPTAELDGRGWASMVTEVDRLSPHVLEGAGETPRFPDTAPWDVQYEYLERSDRHNFAFAVVQQSQVDENGAYDDRWPMHSYMRDGDLIYTYHWQPTEPGPETRVYGYGIRSGLISLAKTHDVAIPR